MSDKREILVKRSNLLQQVRAFFYARSVIEVDTPILSQAATPDVHLHSLATQVQLPGHADSKNYYLHTSPEYPMKRLLCAGSGDIFYLGKVFRDGDVSPRHQIEFTILEWYRLGFSMHDLIDEVVELINSVLNSQRPIESLSYQQVFAKYADIENVFSATAEEYQACLIQNSIPEIVGVDKNDIELWKQLVLTEVIEPQLGQGTISVMYHYPAKDAALAQISAQDSRVAERFEVFVDGMELANGYHELADADLYQARFEESLQIRKELELTMVPIDSNLLESLRQQALPDCSGVALGFDRLLLLSEKAKDISQVVCIDSLNA